MVDPMSHPQASEQKNNFRHSQEFHVLTWGIGCVGLWTGWLLVGWFNSPEYSYNILYLTFTRVLAGRPGGVFLGHMLGVDPLTNIGINFLVDTVAVFFMYPLVVSALKKHPLFDRLKNFVDRLHQAAQTHYHFIRVYGIPGLFLFVLFPLWGTGPVVGCIIGYMMGLRILLNLGIVLGATLSAVMVWMFVSKEFYVWGASYSVYMPAVMLGILLVITFSVQMVGWIKKRH